MSNRTIEKKYYTVTDKQTAELLVQHIQDSDIIAFDTETDGLNVRKGRIVGFSVSGEVGMGFYMPTMVWNAETQTLDECLIEGKPAHAIAKKIIGMLVGKKLIMHNASFDSRFVKNFYGIDLLPSLHADTALLVHTVKEEGAFGIGASPFGLKSIAIMVQKEIGLNVEEAANKEQIELKNSIKQNGGDTTRANYEIYKADLEILSKYAAADTDLTLRIFNHFLPVLQAEGLEKFFFEDEVMPLYREVTIPMEEHGIRLDLDLIEKIKGQIEIDQEKYRKAIITELIALPQVKEWVIDSALATFPPQARGKWATRLCEMFNVDLPKTARGFSFREAAVRDLPESPIRSFLLTNDSGYLEETDILKVSISLWKEIHNGEFLNVQSKQQLGEIAFNYLKEKPLSKTSKGQPQFDDAVIQVLGDKYEWCRNARIYNKLLKIKSTYIDRFYDAAQDNRFFPYFKQNGTVSGRYGSDLQQLPAIKEEGTVDEIILKYNNEIRAFFIADPDTYFIDADFESLEPHIFASITDDKALQEIFNNGHDFYSTVAIRTEKLDQQTDRFPNGVSADKSSPVFLKNLDKAARNRAKGYSLGIAYGMAPYALAMGLGVSQEEGARLHQGYLDGFPGVANWINKSREQFKKHGYIRNKVGRIRHLDKGKIVYDAFGDNIMNWKFRGQLNKEFGKAQVDSWYRDYRNCLNNCLNFQIQSLAASVVNRAALAINREFKKRGWKGQVIAQIHDQLVTQIEKQHAEEAAKIVQHCMETTTQLDGVTLKAPPEITLNMRDGH